jgi:two-component system, NtrC family, nitrogen regulation sensor histidine kinase GlnL
MKPLPPLGLEHLSTAILVLDRDFCVRYANPAAENLFEFSSKTIAGTPVNQLFAETGGLITATEAAFTSGASFTEHEMIMATVAHTYHVSLTVSPIFESTQQLLLEFHQIDKHLKIAREERMHLQQQYNRELLRNLAHEIKNPLGGIRGAAQLLEHELPKPGLREYTQVIIKEADRLQSLMDRLLAPNRSAKLAPVNLHEVLERVRSLILAEHPEGINLRRDYDTSLPELMADHEQLIQIVLNIVRNAVQAMQGQGDIVLRTRVARHVTLAKKNHRLALELQIIDNGPGIPSEIREQIFYPLVTSKAEGTGLGLSIAQTYFAHHGGSIDCESQPGHTVFTVLLPYNHLASH